MTFPPQLAKETTASLTSSTFTSTVSSRHINLRRDREGHPEQFRGSTGCSWRNHGTLHWLLYPQRSGGHLLSCKTFCHMGKEAENLRVNGESSNAAQLSVYCPSRSAHQRAQYWSLFPLFNKSLCTFLLVSRPTIWSFIYIWISLLIIYISNQDLREI